MAAANKALALAFTVRKDTTMEQGARGVSDRGPDTRGDRCGAISTASVLGSLRSPGCRVHRTYILVSTYGGCVFFLSALFFNLPEWFLYFLYMFGVFLFQLRESLRRTQRANLTTIISLIDKLRLACVHTCSHSECSRQTCAHDPNRERIYADKRYPLHKYVYL